MCSLIALKHVINHIVTHITLWLCVRHVRKVVAFIVGPARQPTAVTTLAPGGIGRLKHTLKCNVAVVA